MITGKDQHIIRVICLHVCQILENCIGCSCVPVTVTALFIGGKNSHTTNITVQIPRNTDSDMCIQPQWLILGQNSHRINPGVNTVTQREIYDTIFTSKRYCRLCYAFSQNAKTASLSAGQQHCNHLFLNHAITSCHI